MMDTELEKSLGVEEPPVPPFSTTSWVHHPNSSARSWTTGCEQPSSPLVPVPCCPQKQHGGGGWPTPTPADRANTSACVVPKGSRWKFVPLLGEELDLRRITWRLPPETIPRLSGSSRLSWDSEGLLPEEDSTGGAGSARRSATPQPQAGEGRLLAAPSVLSHPALSQETGGWALCPCLPLCAHPRVGVGCSKALSCCVCSHECQGNPISAPTWEPASKLLLPKLDLRGRSKLR